MPSICFAMSGRRNPDTVIATDDNNVHLYAGPEGSSAAILSKRLKNDGFWVRRVDLKSPEFSETNADDFVVGDLRTRDFVVYSRLIEMKTRAPQTQSG
jgi:hypothetical protein